MFLNAVVFASVLPAESSSSSSSSSNTFSFDPKKIKAAAKNAPPSSVDASTPTGFISQIDLSEAEAFGVKTAPFAFRDCSAPVRCLASLVPSNEFFCPERATPTLIAYHPLQSALFTYAGGKEKPVCRSFGHERISSLSASPDGRLVVGGMESGNLAVWCLESGELVSLLEGAHFQAVRVIRFSPDGRLLATGAADALIKVWQFGAGGFVSSAAVPLYSFAGHSAPVTDLSFSVCTTGSMGRLISCSLDASLRIFDLCDGQCLLELKLPEPLTCLAMDAAELQLFCGSVEGAIYAVDLVASAEPSHCVLKGHRGAVSALAWSPEERALISAGFEDGNVCFWEAQTRQLLKTVSLGQKCGVSGLVVLQRAEVLKTVTAAGRAMVPFKRVGTSVAVVDESVPLKGPAMAVKTMTASGEEVGQLKRENAQLRQINGELVSLLDTVE